MTCYLRWMVLVLAFIVSAPATAGPGIQRRDLSIDLLTKILASDPDVRIRRWAVWRLAEAPPSESQEALVAAMSDEDNLVREYATQAMMSSGPAAVDQLLDSFRTPRARPHVMKVLISIGKPAVIPMSLLLSDPDEAVRRGAAQVLAGIGPAAGDAVPVLARAFRERGSGPEGVRLATALGGIGEPAVSSLLELMDQITNPRIRENICLALGFVGPDALRAVPGLLTALEDHNARVRFAAATALGYIGADEAVPALIERVRLDTNRSVRMHSAVALGEIASRIDETMPALTGLFDSQDDTLASRAVGAVQKIGAPAVVNLAEVFENGSARARGFAATAAGGLGAAAKPLVPLLIEQLGVSTEAVRRKSATGLRMLGDTATTALIHAMAGHDDPGVRGYAALVLGEARVSSPGITSGLVAALKDEDLGVRRLAAWSLGNIGPQDAQAVAGLAAVLPGSDVVLRRTAAWALGNIGPVALAAEQTLSGMVEDTDSSVREEVEEALEKIHGIYQFHGDGEDDP